MTRRTARLLGLRFVEGDELEGRWLGMLISPISDAFVARLLDRAFWIDFTDSISNVRGVYPLPLKEEPHASGPKGSTKALSVDR
jgi:hypothetical protein